MLACPLESVLQIGKGDSIYLTDCRMEKAIIAVLEYLPVSDGKWLK